MVASPSEFQLFDVLDPATEAALTASIERFGVLVPITVDQHGVTLDGHHRERIAAAVGVACPQIEVDCADDPERLEIARTLNADRRQLTAEQRRAVVVELARQGYSGRAIAGATGASEATVRRDIQAEEIASGDAIRPEVVTRSGGGTYPSTRPASPQSDQFARDQATPLPQPDPEPPLPLDPEWAARAQESSAEAERRHDREIARNASARIVGEIRAQVASILIGVDLGEPGLITHAMIDDLTKAVALLEEKL